MKLLGKEIVVSRDRIVYLDNHILVVDKPAMMVTQETDRDKNSLENFTKRFLKETFQKPGNVFIGVVHRLDRDVSGLVVFARTSKALSRLNQTFKAGNLQKIYLGYIEGKLQQKSGVMRDALVKKEHRAVVDPSGRESELYYEVIKEMDRCTLVKIHLKTGRYHQIRVQFASRGHPIVGDKKYGSIVSWKYEGIALQHVEIRFIHPVSKEWLTCRTMIALSDLQDFALK